MLIVDVSCRSREKKTTLMEEIFLRLREFGVGEMKRFENEGGEESGEILTLNYSGAT